MVLGGPDYPVKPPNRITFRIADIENGDGEIALPLHSEGFVLVGQPLEYPLHPA
jgi:hypothetical protein